MIVYILLSNLIVFIIFLSINIFLMRNPDHFINMVDSLDAAYYTMTTHSSVGFGDILPKSRYAKFSSVLHQLCVLVLNIGILSLFINFNNYFKFVII
jgi:hypothetical protein